MNQAEYERIMRAMQHDFIPVNKEWSMDHLAIEPIGFKQRATEGASVARISRAVRNGTYFPQGAPIQLAPNGAILDGRHRCKGIALTDRTVLLPVMSNVPVESFTFIDNTRARTVGQFIETGTVGANAAAVIKALTENGELTRTNGSANGFKGNMHELITYADRNIPELSTKDSDFFRYAQTAGDPGRHVARGSNLALMILAGRKGPLTERLALDWGRALAYEYEWPEEGDPRKAVVNCCTRDRRRLNTHNFLLPRWDMLVRGWNAFVEGESRAFIKAAERTDIIPATMLAHPAERPVVERRRPPRKAT